MVREGLETTMGRPARLKQLLGWLGIARSSWYVRPAPAPARPGRRPKIIDPQLVAGIEALAHRYPWWGYKRIAIIARREGLAVTNKQVYRIFKAAKLLQKPRVREAALYQAARLFELLPARANDLWQADVTYLHIPGHGWWYAVTVIDYYLVSVNYKFGRIASSDDVTRLPRARCYRTFSVPCSLYIESSAIQRRSRRAV